MNYINFFVPSFPHYVTAGSALYRPGDIHRGRAATGVFDLIYVESGELFLTENGIAYSLYPGDYLILSPDGKHFAQRPVSKRTLFHWIHFSHNGDFLISGKVETPDKSRRSLYIAAAGCISIPVHGTLTDEQRQKLMNIHRRLTSLYIDNYQHAYIPVELNAKSILYQQELLLQLLGILQVSCEARKGSYLADNILDYINQYYSSPITLDTLSKQFKFHPAHIIRCLKSEYGVTPIEAVNNVRIDKAKQLLVMTTASIADIASDVGFSTPSYFNRLFRRATNMTPKEYRLSHSAPVSSSTADEKSRRL